MPERLAIKTMTSQGFFQNSAWRKYMLFFSASPANKTAPRPGRLVPGKDHPVDTSLVKSQINDVAVFLFPELQLHNAAETLSGVS